jgi:hypothetical protein
MRSFCLPANRLLIYEMPSLATIMLRFAANRQARGGYLPTFRSPRAGSAFAGNLRRRYTAIDFS